MEQDRSIRLFRLLKNINMNFLFPAFIATSVVLAIPVILHLVNRELPKARYFPSIRFIRRGRIVHHGKSGLKDLLLLFLRLSALALLILACAHPFIPDSDTKDPTNREVVIYCDLTASVPLEKMKDEAAAQVKYYSDKGFRIGLATWPSRAAIIPPSEGDVVLEKIEGLQVSTLSGGHQLRLNQTIASYSRNVDKELVILSDFQAGEWSEELFAHLKFDGELRVKSLAPELRKNLAILGTTVRKHRDHTLVSCLIRNYSPETAKGKLQLTNSRGVEASDFEIAPLKSAHIQVVTDGDLSGVGELELLYEDQMEFDNHYKVWLGAQAPVKVLLVAPMASGLASENEIFFLSKALSVQSGGSRKVIVDTLDVEELGKQNLAYFDAVCLCGAGGFLSDEAFTKVMDYIRNGGTVMATTGKKFASFNLKINNNKIADLAFSRTVNRSQIDGYHSFSSISKDDPLFTMFTKEHRREWMLTRVFGFNQMKVEGDATVLAEIDDEFPALLQLPLGKGRFYLWTFPLDNETSDLPLSPLYLPLIRRLVESSRKAEGVIKLSCGDLVPTISVNKDVRLPKTDIPKVGIFEKVPYQINISSRESTPASLSEFQLKNLIKRVDKVAVDSIARAENGEGDHSPTLWMALLAVLFLCLSYELETDRSVVSPAPSPVE